MFKEKLPPRSKSDWYAYLDHDALPPIRPEAKAIAVLGVATVIGVLAYKRSRHKKLASPKAGS